jgi:hypothetical protein
MAGSFDRYGQLPLMTEAITGDPARHDTTAFREKISQEPDILEIDRRLVDAESTRFTSLKIPASAA